MPDGGGSGVWLAEVSGPVEGERATGWLADWWCRGKGGWPACAEGVRLRA